MRRGNGALEQEITKTASTSAMVLQLMRIVFMAIDFSRILTNGSRKRRSISTDTCLAMEMMLLN